MLSAGSLQLTAYELSCRLEDLDEQLQRLEHPRAFGARDAIEQRCERGGGAVSDRLGRTATSGRQADVGLPSVIGALLASHEPRALEPGEIPARGRGIDAE